MVVQKATTGNRSGFEDRFANMPEKQGISLWSLLEVVYLFPSHRLTALQ